MATESSPPSGDIVGEWESIIEGVVSKDHALDIVDRMEEMPLWKIKLLSAACGYARKRKSSSKRARLSGDLPLAMSEQQFVQFIRAIRNPRVKCHFLLQFFTGARSSELHRVAGSKKNLGLEVTPDNKLVRYHNTKAGGVFQFRPAYGIIPDLVKVYYDVYGSVSPAYARKCMSSVLYGLGDEFTYPYAYRANDGARLKPFRPHSIRHSAATRFWLHTGDQMKAQIFLRHESRSSTATSQYLHYVMDVMRADLEDCMKDLYYLADGVI